MNDELKTRLKDELKLTDEQVAGIGALGVETAADMEFVTEADLTGLGFKPILSRKIIAAFASKAEPAAAMPIAVTVNQPKALGEMGIGELLTLLVGDPTNDDTFSELTGRPQYTEVAAKTEKVAVVTDTGTVNPTATTAYWQYLKKGTPQRRFQGQRTVTLEKALGRVEKLLHHPLMANETIYMGVDTIGCDWTGMDRERMEAAFWAMTTGHKLFPANVDALTAYEELKAETLNKRWAAIVEDYREAVDDRGAQVSLVVTEGRPGSGQVPFGVRPGSNTGGLRAGGVSITGPGNINVGGDIAGRDIHRG